MSKPRGKPLSQDNGYFSEEVELFFEDFEVGQRFRLGQHLVSEAEIVEFAQRYDPQPFHVDPQRAQQTVFHGLIASGWQTAAIWMRLYWDGLLHRAASLGSPGIEELRWRAPVRPGEILHGSVEVASVRPSARHPERGAVVLKGELTAARDEVKLTLSAWGLFGRRGA